MNDAPSIGVPAPATTGFRQSVTFSAAAGTQISLSDIDAGSGNLRLTIVATSGTVSLSQTNGLTFISGTGTADGTLIVQGNLTNLNNALNGLVFNPNSTFRGSTTVDFTVSDLGNNGSGGRCKLPGQVVVDVQPAAQRLTVVGPTSLAANAFQVILSATAGAGVQFVDVYAENTTLTVSLAATNGIVTLSGTSGLTFLAGSSSAAEMTFTGSVSNVNAALEGTRINFDGSGADLDDCCPRPVARRHGSAVGAIGDLNHTAYRVS